jgi:hypothetical protein
MRRSFISTLPGDMVFPTVKKLFIIAGGISPTTIPGHNG